ncbi:MAG TPA: 4Fe-4S dicluster domain-containing protein [Campylobacteraceae bacterium]|jgi:formate hydrogenlyase subunit 6/NADH:ubiquinone oxidoreductase subunit I|nr:4Fe-4S dicluster domain-containing protein [Campylobacteraceae bacterium]
MSVIIGDTCINCDACLQVCPVDAIVDDATNPIGESRYYVHPEKCVECVGIYDDPQCAAICPSLGTITWDLPYTVAYEPHYLNSEIYNISSTKGGKLKTPTLREKKYRKDIPLELRGIGKEVQEEPENVDAE